MAVLWHVCTSLLSTRCAVSHVLRWLEGETNAGSRLGISCPWPNQSGLQFNGFQYIEGMEFLHLFCGHYTDALVGHNFQCKQTAASKRTLDIKCLLRTPTRMKQVTTTLFMFPLIYICLAVVRNMCSTHHFMHLDSSFSIVRCSATRQVCAPSMGCALHCERAFFARWGSQMISTGSTI